MGAALTLALPASKAQNWEKIFTGYDYVLTALEFPEKQSLVGYTAGQSVTYNGDGIVLKTTDGGTTWNPVWTGPEQGIEGISFPTVDTGYVTGWNGYFAKTTDGGNTWTQITIAQDVYYFSDVVFKDSENGILTAWLNNDVAIYWTNNGGVTWTRSQDIPTAPYIACYVSGETYFAACWQGIMRSVDDGKTWETVFSSSNMLIDGIRFFTPDFGMAGSEDGRILKTVDGGNSWEVQQFADGYPLWRDFVMVDSNTIYVVGTPEVIWKSTDRGQTWEDDYPQSEFYNAIYEITVTPDNTIMACSSQGFIFRKQLPSTNFQVTFQIVDQAGSSIADAQITVDGVQSEVGNYAFQLSAGQHSYLINKEGYIPIVDDFNLVGSDTTISVSLQLSSVETRMAENEVLCFPNPCSEKLNISYYGEVISATLFDIAGNRVNQLFQQNGQFSINMSAVEKGVYVLELQIQPSTTIRRLIIKN